VLPNARLPHNPTLRVLSYNSVRVGQKKKPYIKVNTRELNRELCIGLSILYIPKPHGLC